MRFITRLLGGLAALAAGASAAAPTETRGPILPESTNSVPTHTFTMPQKEFRFPVTDVFDNRISYSMTNLLSAPYVPLYFPDLYRKNKAREIVDNHVFGVVRSSAKQAIREMALAEFDLSLPHMIEDMLSGHEEKNTLAVPLHVDEEGRAYALPPQERHFTVGLRPFRSDPYVYITYSRSSYDVHFRAYYDKIEFSALKPLGKRWVASAGTSFWPLARREETQWANFIGIGGALGKGNLRMSGNWNDRGKLLLATYSWSF